MKAQLFLIVYRKRCKQIDKSSRAKYARLPLYRSQRITIDGERQPTIPETDVASHLKHWKTKTLYGGIYRVP